MDNNNQIPTEIIKNEKNIELTNNKSEMFLMFAIMMALIIANHELSKINFYLIKEPISLYVLVYPWFFYITGYTRKIFGFKNTLVLILGSTCFWILYYLFESFLLFGYSFNLSFFVANILVFLLIQLIYLLIYSKLLKKGPVGLLDSILLILVIICLDSAFKIACFYLIDNVLLIKNYIFYNLETILIAFILLFINFFTKKSS